MNDSVGLSAYQLRRLAEQLVDLSDSGHSSLSKEDMVRVLHELEVHQEELKMQNEELRSVHRHLQESRDRYADLYDFAPVGYLTVDANGSILEANLNAATMVGIERGKLIGSRLALHCHEHSRRKLHEHLEEVLASKTRVSCELVFTVTVGTARDIRLESNFVAGDTSDDGQCRVIMTDITLRKQAERHLMAEQQLLLAMLDIQEQERRMVSLEIHDGLLQHVIAAHMRVQTINGVAIPEANELIANDVAAVLQQAISEGRRMIRDLRPLVLDDEGIVEAIRHLIAEHACHVNFAFDCDIQFDRLEAKLEGVAFRIIQEAMNNIKKHAQTDRALVQLQQRNGVLEIVVRDEGVGFNAAQVPQDRFGLRGIRERARLLGGMAGFESAPGKGTTVSAKLPIGNNPAGDVESLS